MVLRITVLVKKLETITEEQFHKYWVYHPISLSLAIFSRLRTQSMSSSKCLSGYLPAYSQSESHPSIFLSVPACKRNLLKYSQYHIDSSTTAAVRAANGATAAVEFNGAAEFWVEKLDDMVQIFQDPEYASKVVPDEKSFLDRDGATLLIGHEEVKWDGSKMV